MRPAWAMRDLILTNKPPNQWHCFSQLTELVMSLLLSDLIVAKQLPATAGSPESLNISSVWNIYFLFLIKMNLKENAHIDCFIK